MITCIKTDSGNVHFQELVRALDAYLAIIDGEEHAFYHQFNKIISLKHAVVAYDGEVPVACGAIKEYDKDCIEVKRMYVLPDQRSKGIASIVLRELEAWGRTLGYTRAMLETGKRQADAIALYSKNGYHIIPNFGQYVGIENSVCFEKQL